MQVAMGALGWHPSEFWRATTVEFRLAYEGWAEVHGVGEAEDNLFSNEEWEIIYGGKTVA